jgi:glutamate racemase
MLDERAIGIFDSGVGGLTVLEAIHRRVPDESTIYLGDLARCPYGTRPTDEIRRFSRQIGDTLANLDIKMLVVACNTATASAFDDLSERYSFPVVGVVAPGAAEALRLTKTNRIGVVATDRTVATGAYRSAIVASQPAAKVVERSASWLVPLIERGSPARGAVASKLEPVLSEMRAEAIDVLILGCTHFPLVRDIFESEIGPQVTVLDSAITTAGEVSRLLTSLNLRAKLPPEHRLLVTGPAEAFDRRARAMFSASPQIETIELLDPVA